MQAHIFFDTSLSRIALESFKENIRFGSIDDHLSIKPTNADEEHGVVWLVDTAGLRLNAQLIYNWQQKYPQFKSRLILMSDAEIAENTFDPIALDQIQLILPASTTTMIQIRKACELQLNALHAEFDRLNLQEKLANSYIEIRKLTTVGQALATERDFDRLIELILSSAIELTSADGGSIYLTEKKQGDRPTHIRFKKSAMQLETDEFLLPIDKHSIAGYVALTGEPLILDDVHNLSPETDYSYNAEYDKAHNYYTRSMMVIPMKNHHNDVIGIIQLINRKRDFDQRLTLEDLKGNGVVPFNRKDYSLVSAMAGQAAVAIENNALLIEIQALFEGFVKASVTAIEQRDPTTSGHSFRVADYSTHIAMAVNRATSPRFTQIRFSRNQLQELRYAALLHDFGKVGVRENVLIKAKKLYPEQLELIRWRFNFIRKDIEARLLEKKIAQMKSSRPEAWPEIELEFNNQLEKQFIELDAMFSAILSANEPSVLAAGSFDFLKKIAENKIQAYQLGEVPYVSRHELTLLSIRKGTLDDKERQEIESHVTHTYNFLKQIPWTPNLRFVPEIAYGHHEKLNGVGYPLGKSEAQISLQTRMMTIADIYDALTAWDRPYKKALPPEKALDILTMEVNEGHVDSDLLKVFIEADVFKRIEIIRPAEGAPVQTNWD